MDDAGGLKFVRELKVPWVRTHFLHEIIKDEKRMKAILGE